MQTLLVNPGCGNLLIIIIPPTLARHATLLTLSRASPHPLVVVVAAGTSSFLPAVGSSATTLFGWAPNTGGGAPAAAAKLNTGAVSDAGVPKVNAGIWGEAPNNPPAGFDCSSIAFLAASVAAFAAAALALRNETSQAPVDVVSFAFSGSVSSSEGGSGDLAASSTAAATDFCADWVVLWIDERHLRVTT